eukprot:scaffold2325_cov374-Prasinococcus_capsulatus_cf.AAC.5
MPVHPVSITALVTSWSDLRRGAPPHCPLCRSECVADSQESVATVWAASMEDNLSVADMMTVRDHVASGGLTVR